MLLTEVGRDEDGRDRAFWVDRSGYVSVTNEGRFQECLHSYVLKAAIPSALGPATKEHDIPCRRAAHATATSVRPRDLDMAGLTVEGEL